MIHLLPFQCVALSHVNLSFYSISIHLNIYVDLGVGREARHRKQTGNSKIYNQRREKGYINTRSFSMSLRAQAIDSPGTFLRGRLCGPVADGQFWLQGMR